MDRARDELLPRSGLALDEHGDLSGDHLLEKLDDAEHLLAPSDEDAVPRLFLERAAQVQVLDLETVLRVLQLLVEPRVLERDRDLRGEALEDRDVLGSELVCDGMGVDVEDAEHASGIQDRKGDHGAEREVANAL